MHDGEGNGNPLPGEVNGQRWQAAVQGVTKSQTRVSGGLCGFV